MKLSRLLISICIIFSIAILSGCNTQKLNHSGKESSSEASFPDPAFAGRCSPDNQKGTLNYISVYPSSDGKGFFIPWTGKFYDISQGSTVRMCALPGCEHNDKDCPGRMEHLESFMEAKNVWYAFCQDDCSVWLLEIFPDTGERNTLCRWDGKVGESTYGVNSCFYAGGHIFVTLTYTEKLSTTLFQSIDLKTAELTTIEQSSALGMGELLGGYDNCALLYWVGLSEELPSFEAYLENHPDGTEMDYYGYLHKLEKEGKSTQIRQYDLTTMEYTDLYSKLQNGRNAPIAYMFSTNAACFGEYFLYRIENTILRYSMKTGKVEELITKENINNGGLYDGKLLYLVNDRTTLEVRILDLSTGEDLLVEKKSADDAMTFSIHKETGGAFIGLYDGKAAWILKEDFYAGRFDRAVFYVR